MESNRGTVLDFELWRQSRWFFIHYWEKSNAIIPLERQTKCDMMPSRAFHGPRDFNRGFMNQWWGEREYFSVEKKKDEFAEAVFVKEYGTFPLRLCSLSRIEASRWVTIRVWYVSTCCFTESIRVFGVNQSLVWPKGIWKSRDEICFALERVQRLLWHPMRLHEPPRDYRELQGRSTCTFFPWISSHVTTRFALASVHALQWRLWARGKVRLRNFSYHIFLKFRFGPLTPRVQWIIYKLCTYHSFNPLSRASRTSRTRVERADRAQGRKRFVVYPVLGFDCVKKGDPR